MMVIFNLAGGFEGFHSSVDPEELFRKIFGDAGFRMSGFQDFAESTFGFSPATEVHLISVIKAMYFVAYAVVLSEIEFL